MEPVGVFAITYAEALRIFYSRFFQNVEYVYKIGNSPNYLLQCLADESVICKNLVRNVPDTLLKIAICLKYPYNPSKVLRKARKKVS